MVLTQEVVELLHRVLREYRGQSKLREYSYSARRKLLLVGPPGCGKTMTASALAGELKLPLLSVQLHSLITKFMGQTAVKLRSVFDAILETTGVYFFDEFDAIGSDRGAKNDVGEIRRVLNSFLQFLEQEESDSIVIAATNYEAMLDDALFRRFDDVIRYQRPNSEQVILLISNRLGGLLGKQIAWNKLTSSALGLSHAEIAKACDDAAKQCILSESGSVDTAMLESSLRNRLNFDEGNHREKLQDASL